MYVVIKKEEKKCYFNTRLNVNENYLNVVCIESLKRGIRRFHVFGFIKHARNVLNHRGEKERLI